MAVCLLKDQIQNFRDALKKKDLKMEELLNMGTEELTAKLKEYAGENTKDVVTLFEQKRILKNRVLGLKNAVRKLGEIGRYEPAKKALIEQALKEFESKQQERIFNPQEGEAFYNALADKILGTHITREQAQKMFELQKTADELKQRFNESTPDSSPERIAYGAAQNIALKYIEELKTGNLSVREMLKKTLNETKELWAKDKLLSTRELLMKTLDVITQNSIAMVATLDNSFLGRQGLVTLMTHPTKWYPTAIQSFKDIWTDLKGGNAADALNADLLSKKDYISGEYQKAGIIPKTEEPFPTSLPAKIPGFGRIFRASEDAFVGSAVRMRISLYDMLKKNFLESGNEWTPEQAKDIGKLVGSMTAKGTLRKVGESHAVKLFLWAPRMLKANWDILTAHTLGTGLETSFTRKQAAYNLLKIVGTTATVMAIANAIKPGSAELDPTSTNFGKIKIGNTSFDITGGRAALITLAARQLTGMSKSSSTGVKTQLGSGVGEVSRRDVFLNFLEGKTTPPVGMVIDWMKGKNFQGQKPTLANSAYGAFTPIVLQNAIQLKDDASAEAVLGVLLDAIGVNANTYQPSNTDWSQSTGVELQQFNKKIGDAKFKEANDLYNQQVSDWYGKVRLDPRFSTLSDEVKQQVILNKKADIKDAIFRKYGFHYNAPPKKPTPKF